MKTNSETFKLYQQFRHHSPFMLVGHNARLALESAKTLIRFRELESLGLVRMRCEAEEESYISVCGEPEAYTNGQGKRVSAEDAQKELIATLDRDGVWWTCSEWRASENDEWQIADSCGMHTGYKNPLSPFENCYVMDEMRAAIDALESHLAETASEQTESFRMACADIATA